MRIGEILRKLADIADRQETGGEGTEVVNRPETSEVDTAPAMDTADIEGRAQVNTKTMISPLQMQAELLKKMTGAEGQADICPQCNATPCACEEPDELVVIKQNAGIA
jgi:hypothetical protein